MKHLLDEWSEKVSANKKGADKLLFDDLIKIVKRRLEINGYEMTMQYLGDNYIQGKGSTMVGGHFLSTNSKLIKDKLWSLNKKGTNNS